MKHHNYTLVFMVDIPYTGREAHKEVVKALSLTEAIVQAMIRLHAIGWDVVSLLSGTCDGQHLELNQDMLTEANVLRLEQELKEEKASNNALLKQVGEQHIELRTLRTNLSLAAQSLQANGLDMMHSSDTIKDLQQQWEDHLNTIKGLREEIAIQKTIIKTMADQRHECHKRIAELQQHHADDHQTSQGYLKTIKTLEHELYQAKAECNKHKHKVNKLKKLKNQLDPLDLQGQIEELKGLVETVHTGLVSTVEAIQASDKDLRSQLDKKFNAVVPYLHHHYPYCI